jgi:nucleoside-triphosphatase
MGKALLLTGHPGIGKTTIIRQIIKDLGDKAGGFYTEEIFGPGGRKGFRLFTLDGKEAVIAHKDFRDPKMPRVGRYGVDINALDRVGVAAMQRAMQQKKIVVVDEIGKMELLSSAFRDTLMLTILGPAPVLGTVIFKPHPEGDVFKLLAQVTLWEVNQRSRVDMAEKVRGWLRHNAILAT